MTQFPQILRVFVKQSQIGHFFKQYLSFGGVGIINERMEEIHENIISLVVHGKYKELVFFLSDPFIVNWLQENPIFSSPVTLHPYFSSCDEKTIEKITSLDIQNLTQLLIFLHFSSDSPIVELLLKKQII